MLNLFRVADAIKKIPSGVLLLLALLLLILAGAAAFVL